MRQRFLFAAMAGVAVVAFVAILCVPSLAAKTSGKKVADPIVLTVVGSKGTFTYTMADLEAMPAYQGYAGYKNSANTIVPPKEVKGVPLTYLASLAGGITSANMVTVTAVDQYGMTYTYSQVVNGAWDAYNLSGTPVKPTEPFTTIVAYEYDNKPIDPPPDGDGPLRIWVAQPDSGQQVVDGSLLVKWVTKIQIQAAQPNWWVWVYGPVVKGRRLTYKFDRSEYMSCSAPGCHGSTVRIGTHLWSGVPLFLLLGKVDRGKAHGYGAFNAVLAQQGYWVDIYSKSGAHVRLSSRTVMNRSDIILSGKINGEPLPSSMYPLRLIGPGMHSPMLISRLARMTATLWKHGR